MCKPCFDQLRSEQKFEEEESEDSEDSGEGEEEETPAPSSLHQDDTIVPEHVPVSTTPKHNEGAARAQTIVDLEDDAETSVSQQQAESSKKSSIKRSLSPDQHTNEPNNKRLRPLVDELHRSGDTGISDSHVEQEMDGIFWHLRQAVLHFHEDADIKAEQHACIAKMSTEQFSTFYQMLLGDEKHALEMQLDEVLTSYDVLLGLLGLMFHTIVLQTPGLTPALRLEERTFKAVKAELGYSGMSRSTCT